MLHNLVITDSGSATDVGLLAIKPGIRGKRLNYVPSTPKVVYHTLLL